MEVSNLIGSKRALKTQNKYQDEMTQMSLLYFFPVDSCSLMESTLRPVGRIRNDMCLAYLTVMANFTSNGHRLESFWKREQIGL